MLHRSVKARPGQRMLIHGASGGVGSAMLQLAKHVPYISTPASHRLTGDGVDAVFDGIGGDNCGAPAMPCVRAAVW
jgi:NADPH2:quinone reductase